MKKELFKYPSPHLSIKTEGTTVICRCNYDSNLVLRRATMQLLNVIPSHSMHYLTRATATVHIFQNSLFDR